MEFTTFHVLVVWLLLSLMLPPSSTPSGSWKQGAWGGGTLYTAHPQAYTVHYTPSSLYCTLHTMKFMLQSTHHAILLYTVQYVVYVVKFIWYTFKLYWKILYCKLHSVKFILHSLFPVLTQLPSQPDIYIRQSYKHNILTCKLLENYGFLQQC